MHVFRFFSAHALLMIFTTDHGETPSHYFNAKGACEGAFAEELLRLQAPSSEAGVRSFFVVALFQVPLNLALEADKAEHQLRACATSLWTIDSCLKLSLV